MKSKIWIVVIAAVILALAGGTIAAQNILGGDANKQLLNEAPATLSGEGVLVGRIDSHSVEIEIGGEPRAFGLCDALRDADFAAGPIRFKYYVDENGRSIITEAQWTKDEEDTAGAVQTAEGIFNGQADSHTVEIRVGQTDQSFTFVEGVTVNNLQTGDVILFDYKEDENGRLVILRLEKVREAKKDDPNVLSAAGIFTGRIDSHSVEIKVNGEPRAFGLSDALRDAEFAAGPISFKYYVDKNGRSIITEADWTKAETGAVQTAEGIFNGQADNHTVEIKIGGEAKAFGLAEGISFAGIKEGEQVFIAFQQIGGRPTIIKVERIS
jgi:hypothetical protein